MDGGFKAMVDNITLRMAMAFPKLQNSRIIYIGVVERGRRVLHYALLNDKGDHELRIYDYGSYFIIKGSIRKWFLGSSSEQDLSPEQIIKVIYELAKALNVHPFKIAYAKIIGMEVGKTFTLSGTNCASLLEKIHGYSSLYPKPYKTSLTFEGQDYHFKLYDKVEKILHDFPKLKKTLTAKNKLRIELRLKDRKGMDEKLRGIYSLSQFMINYRMVVVTLLKEIKKLRFWYVGGKSDSISCIGKDMKYLKRYHLSRSIRLGGIAESYRFLKEINNVNQYHYRKEFHAVLQEFESANQYGRRELLKDIKSDLAKEISSQRN